MKQTITLKRKQSVRVIKNAPKPSKIPMEKIRKAVRNVNNKKRS